MPELRPDPLAAQRECVARQEVPPEVAQWLGVEPAVKNEIAG